MSLDNAAIVPLTIVEGDEFDSMSDREVLLYIARNIRDVRAIADAVQEQVAPVMDSLSSNPMLKMFFRK